jgi:hypothetical protein
MVNKTHSMKKIFQTSTNKIVFICPVMSKKMYHAQNGSQRSLRAKIMYSLHKLIKLRLQRHQRCLISMRHRCRAIIHCVYEAYVTRFCALCGPSVLTRKILAMFTLAACTHTNRTHTAHSNSKCTSRCTSTKVSSQKMLISVKMHSMFQSPAFEAQNIYSQDMLLKTM